MADELTGNAAALATVSDIVGTPENPNVSAVVRRRLGRDSRGNTVLESDDSKALRKAGYSPLQRALISSPLAEAVARSQKLSQADARIEQGDQRIDLGEKALSIREREVNTRIMLQESRERDAQQHITRAQEFFLASDGIDVTKPGALVQLHKAKALIPTNTTFGEDVMKRADVKEKQILDYRKALEDEVMEAQQRGYTGIVKNADGTIDPYRSVEGIGAWAAARENDKIAREEARFQERNTRQDSQIASGREFQAAQSDVQALRAQRAAAVKRMDEAETEEEKAVVEQEIETIQATMKAATKDRSQATNPATTAPSTTAEKIAINPSTGERLILRNGQWQPL